MSYSYISDAHKNKITFIKIKASNIEDLVTVERIATSEKLSNEEISKLLIVSEVKEFPKILSEDEYIFVLKANFKLTSLDLKEWSDIIGDPTDEEDDIKVFLTSDIDVKRIKKSLLPFL